jgi:UDP-2-acetamido-3-amino-2,3-dideoxy-glucuronate N-acetyltransferase
MSSEIFVHDKAIVEPGAELGAGTRVWAFAHILPGARIGKDVNICDNVFIENDVIVGDRVTIKCGVQLWDGIRVENDVFIGPNATFTNDAFPRSKQHPEKYTETLIRRNASIGANATILPGLIIGTHAMVGAGAVVTENVPPYAIVLGNPARIQGYAPNNDKARVEARDVSTFPGSEVTGVRIISLPIVKDMRGTLSVGEYSKHVPFVPKRYFIVFDVPSRKVRGEHAHKMLEQFLVCVNGSCSVVVDDGKIREEFTLDRPNIGIYIPPMVWATQYKYSSDAVLLVLASDEYDPQDYIRDYDDFMEMVRGVNSS